MGYEAISTHGISQNTNRSGVQVDDRAKKKLLFFLLFSKEVFSGPIMDLLSQCSCYVGVRTVAEDCKY